MFFWTNETTYRKENESFKKHFKSIIILKFNDFFLTNEKVD